MRGPPRKRRILTDSTLCTGDTVGTSYFPHSDSWVGREGADGQLSLGSSLHHSLLCAGAQDAWHDISQVAPAYLARDDHAWMYVYGYHYGLLLVVYYDSPCTRRTYLWNYPTSQRASQPRAQRNTVGHLRATISMDTACIRTVSAIRASR